MMDYQKKKQLGILVKIAIVDEEFADSEKEVIQKIAAKYGASQQDLDQLYDTEDFNETLAPMGVSEKMDFMMDCMLVILADNVVTDSEESFALTMASKLGFNHDVVPFLIENKDTPREEMNDLLLNYMVH
ncbi:MAG: hypothetical protein ABJN36_05795 [Cyclobacteriaceae bacterium]